MKLLTKLVFVLVLALFSGAVMASSTSANNNGVSADSSNINVQAEISMWYEYHKNGDFNTAIKHAWNIVKVQPEFSSYKFYEKFEEMIWDLRDKAATDDEKVALADTMLYVYDLALKNDAKKKPYYLARRAFVLETWYDLSFDEVSKAYEEAMAADADLDPYYIDRYAKYCIANNDKIKALELYGALSEKYPDDAQWVDKMQAIAENPEELVNITKQAWMLDKNNTERAWTFVSAALRIKDYTNAIEGLEFLTTSNPEVINYWQKLANAYEKSDQTDNAISAYKKLIELQPDFKDAYINLAILYKNMNQLSVARNYLYKAARIDPNWGTPYWIEGQLYEQAARDCGSFKFEDKLVYLLAVDTYKKAATREGQYKGLAKDRVSQLSTTVPTNEEYFFRKHKAGTELKIKGDCYNWINKSVTVPNLK